MRVQKFSLKKRIKKRFVEEIKIFKGLREK